MGERLTDPTAILNLAKATVLALEPSAHGLDILAQILRGFGVLKVEKCSTVEEAVRVIDRTTIDLFLIDPQLGDGDGYAFMREIRRSRQDPQCFAPIIVLTGHTAASSVEQARDAGANFLVAKPITPNVLLDRIVWLSRERRQWVETDTYVGPDRRFKFEGPPPGCDGRRHDDLSTPIGQEGATPNLSQSEIDNFMRPQKVIL